MRSLLRGPQISTVTGSPTAKISRSATALRRRIPPAAAYRPKPLSSSSTPRVGNPSPKDIWHGSVYSPPGQPQLASGVVAGTSGVPAGANQLKTNNMTFRPVLPVPGDGLVHTSACLDIPAFHPWTHIVGGTLTYNDYEYTGLVFRLEQSWSSKEPRDSGYNSAARLIEQANGGQLAVPNQRDFETRGKRYTQVWRSMVGFDYLRAIAPGLGHSMSNELLRSLLTDQWFFTFQFLNEYDAHADHMGNAASFTNRYSTWNPFFTVSGSGFFLHQKLNPLWAVAADASVGFTPLLILQIKYFITPQLEMRVGEDLYMGSRYNEDPGGLHYYADRDNTYVRLTYYLL